MTPFILPLRGVQALFSIIVLGLTAYLVDDARHWWWSSPDSVDFLLFTSVWTLLVVAYLVLVPSRFPQFAHKYAILAVEAVTMIFWFAGWVAVAALWGDTRCRHSTWCSCGIAAIIFGALTWLTFVATTVFAGLHVRRTARSDTAPPPQMQGV
ncbi:hypothetical protein M011DRAFT_396754 [Sporormia fimetaria CBS 119925]|uniref:MARVEL domain-containing protein n=1 Tax=Sporormia fimetaria CBS 119925 TaxID=1340428 RepID=A0A6A6VHQ7_9PLEO|nr:hypothetical protein M011DRAFT_396754 [Sporormia fimetaria CBS 119925]